MSIVPIPFRNFIAEWFDRYEMADFDKFIYLWMSFNAWLSQRTDSKEDMNRDRDMIEWFKENYQHVFEKALETNSELKEALDWAVQKGVMDMKREVIVKPEDITDFPNVMEFVYKVRCNLFHGSSRRDASIDRMTVMHATTILDGIYRLILEADKKIRKNLMSGLASRPARNT